MPRRGRDQNVLTLAPSKSPGLPECPGGGEIKTNRDQRWFAKSRYQNAPEGARSKRYGLPDRSDGRVTRMPRRGRDQNAMAFLIALRAVLPECPGGGEIKTSRAGAPIATTGYQNAPEGARSKRNVAKRICDLRVTRMPRRGRDQNGCWMLKFTKDTLPECPGGGEIKTAHRTHAWRMAGYQNAPEGARSKHGQSTSTLSLTVTRMPRRGRDQNEITGFKFTARGYQNAPEGARSKRIALKGFDHLGVTRMPRRGRDQWRSCGAVGNRNLRLRRI